ncbi:hypothetical protein O181_013270 [Austropuccinia psidii MF-1]|uniref:Uncharacterized protein n=1 Tax=Austropuccinia psidii MF-1 TaxID=1389203 RepID=A0A9Q3BYP3_9BASI|nr:hypothetical protein [Austropuccinia psidii MF-1]
MNNKNFKLTRTNYLDWKPQMKDFLIIFGYYYLIKNTEAEEETTLADILDSQRKEKELAILCLNCDVRLASQFTLECSDNPQLFWEAIDKRFPPKTLRNQIRYLSEICSYDLSAGKIGDNIKSLIDITQSLYMQNH